MLADRPRWQQGLFLTIVVAAGWQATAMLVGSYLEAAVGIAAGVALFALVAVATRRHGGDEPLAYVIGLHDIRRPNRRHLRLAGLALAAGLCFQLAIGLTMALLAPETTAATHGSVDTEPTRTTAVLVLFAYAVVGAPILEELLMRNGMQKLLTDLRGPVVAVVLTSVVFAALHVPAYGGFETPAEALAIPLAVVFVDSLLYGWAYWKTSNVVVPIVAHAASNAVALLSYLL